MYPSRKERERAEPIDILSMLESYSHWICSRWEYLFDDCSDIGTIALILCVREPFTSNDSIQFLIGFRRDMWMGGYQGEKPLDGAR